MKSIQDDYMAGASISPVVPGSSHLNLVMEEVTLTDISEAEDEMHFGEDTQFIKLQTWGSVSLV